MSNHIQALGEADRCGGLPFAKRRGSDRGNDDILAAAAALLESLDRLNADLRLGPSVRLYLVIVEAECAGNLADWSRGDAARNLKVRRKSHGVSLRPRLTYRRPRGLQDEHGVRHGAHASWDRAQPAVRAKCSIDTCSIDIADDALAP